MELDCIRVTRGKFSLRVKDMRMLILLVLCYFVIASIGFGCYYGVRVSSSWEYTHKEREEVEKYEIGIRVDGKFSIEEREQIKEAIRSWNYVLNGYVVLKVDNWEYTGGVEDIWGWEIMKIGKDDIRIPKSGKGLKVLAFADKIGGTGIYLVEGVMGVGDIFGVTLHEMGHLLGAGHKDGTMMDGKYNKVPAICIDYWTMSKAAIYLGLDVEKLNYCKIS